LVEKIDKAIALVAHHPLHLVLSGDVLNVPEAIAGAPRDRGDGDVEPACRGAARVGEWHGGDGAATGDRLAAQPLKSGARLGAGDGDGKTVEHRAIIGREKIIEGGVGIGNATVRRDDKLRVRRGFERLAQYV